MHRELARYSCIVLHVDGQHHRRSIAMPALSPTQRRDNHGHSVTNRLVCSTPFEWTSEFASADLFARGIARRRLIQLFDEIPEPLHEYFDASFPHACGTAFLAGSWSRGRIRELVYSERAKKKKKIAVVSRGKTSNAKAFRKIVANNQPRRTASIRLHTYYTEG